MKKFLLLTIFFSLPLILLPSPVSAQSENAPRYEQFIQPLTERLATQYGTDVTIKKGEVIEDNFVRFANTVTINGDVHGDVIVAANTVTINGQVSGDVIAAANTITLNGPVTGNVRVAAGDVEINNTVGKNVNILAGQATVTEEASVSWSLSFFAGEMNINSPVGGNIYGYGGDVTLNSSAGSNVTLMLDATGSVTLQSKAAIGGNFQYRSQSSATIQKGAKIKGDTVHKLLPANVLKARLYLARAWIFGKIVSLFSLLLVGTVIVSLFKKKAEVITRAMAEEPSLKMLWGLLWLVAVPLAALLTSLTIIGIPLAIIVMALYFFFVCTSQIFVGLLIGQKILAPRQAEGKNQKEVPLIWVMMLGVFLFFIISNAPYIGWIFSFIGTIWFLGTLWKMMRKHNEPAQINDKQQ